MSVSHTVKVEYLIEGDAAGEPVRSYTISSEGGDDVSLSVADSTTDQLVAFTCDFSQAKFFYIYSDQDVTICTNDASSGSPDQTLTITATIPFLWIYGSGITCPITTDITALYATNASGSTANIPIRKLEDLTV